MPESNPITNDRAAAAFRHRYQAVGDQVYDVTEESFLHPCARNAERIAAALNEAQEFPWEGMGPTPEEVGSAGLVGGPHILVRAAPKGPLSCYTWRAGFKRWANPCGDKLGVDWSPVSWRHVPAYSGAEPAATGEGDAE